MGLRVARMMPRGVLLRALTSRPERSAEMRLSGITPLLGNLDHAASLRRLAGVATRVLYLAPPPGSGDRDPRLRALLQALWGRSLPRSVVYASTSGVYGDCAGARVRETQTPRPENARAKRRLDAEMQLRWWGRATAVRSSILRIPGIYARDRVGGDPVERVRQATPVLRTQDDVFTNHIHADDLARTCIVAMWRASPQRVYHAVDDTEMLMGDYLDAVAALFGLAPSPRLSRAEAAQTLSPQRMSFLNESRRLANDRLKIELRLRLRYPTVLDGLRSR